ncbi:MAG: hypothetical protein M1837_007458 [Sclerophora amabilis]|nr:MAG: hypothetical protein M1837_007458 [Sclerophora amabilis]
MALSAEASPTPVSANALEPRQSPVTNNESYYIRSRSQGNRDEIDDWWVDQFIRDLFGRCTEILTEAGTRIRAFNRFNDNPFEYEIPPEHRHPRTGGGPFSRVVVRVSGTEDVVANQLTGAIVTHIQGDARYGDRLGPLPYVVEGTPWGREGFYYISSANQDPEANFGGQEGRPGAPFWQLEIQGVEEGEPNPPPLDVGEPGPSGIHEGEAFYGCFAALSNGGAGTSGARKLLGEPPIQAKGT